MRNPGPLRIEPGCACAFASGCGLLLVHFHPLRRPSASGSTAVIRRSCALSADHLGARRARPSFRRAAREPRRSSLGYEAHRRELRGLLGADARRRYRRPARSVVATTSPGAQRAIERQIDRRQPGRVAAVAGAVGAQRLAIGEGVLAVGVALAIAADALVDVAAEIDLRDAGRAERLAHLSRRRVAAHASAENTCRRSCARRRPGRSRRAAPVRARGAAG